MKSMLFTALTVVIAILAMVGQHIYSKHWAVIDRVDPLEFDRDAKFTVKEVPSTYYHQGQLKTILPEVSPLLLLVCSYKRPDILLTHLFVTMY